MAIRRRWAGVLSRAPLVPLPDPHPASAAAVVEGTTYCSSILPWRTCGGLPVWVGADHAAKTERTVAELVWQLPQDSLIWGGDWNHALSGREGAGSLDGRAHVQRAVEKLGLSVATASLPHQQPGQLSIDHIAVKLDRAVAHIERLPADGLSDHDCYVAEVEDVVEET